MHVSSDKDINNKRILYSTLPKTKTKLKALYMHAHEQSALTFFRVSIKCICVHITNIYRLEKTSVPGKKYTNGQPCKQVSDSEMMLDLRFKPIAPNYHCHLDGCFWLCTTNCPILKCISTIYSIIGLQLAMCLWIYLHHAMLHRCVDQGQNVVNVLFTCCLLENALISGFGSSRSQIY